MSKVDAIRFILRCQNWREIAVPIATHQKIPKIILRNGLRFEAPAIHWYDVDEIIFNHGYNPLHLHIERNDIVVDIGANIGLFTVYAASITQKTVYAYEPFPNNFEVLKQNIHANGLNNVIPYRLAVSDKSGIELLYVNEDYAGHRLKNVVDGKGGKYIEVPTTTLQDIMDSNNLEQIDFLKLDCEGAEGLILESTSIDYLKRVRKIAMEFHAILLKISPQDMRKLLEEGGFTTSIIWHPESQLGSLYGWRD